MLSKFAIVRLVACIHTALATSEAALACPEIHVFGARETTAPPGYGTAGAVVNSILSSHPGTTAEAISYPACGGQSSCGGISYAQSVQQGTAAVLNQVRTFAQQCPGTKLILVGYSQVIVVLLYGGIFTNQHPVREEKSLTMLCAIRPALHPTTSKQQSLWATPASEPGLPSTWAHAMRRV